VINFLAFQVLCITVVRSCPRDDITCKLRTLFHFIIILCDTKLVDADTDLYNVVIGNLQFTFVELIVS
jgi:hypothetical protein